MDKHLDQTRLFVIIAILALFTCVNPTLGQSDRDLRVENQRLKIQSKQLERELNAAKAKIEKLTKRVESLEKALKEAHKTAKKPKEQPKIVEVVTIDESVASASPRALFNAVKTSYEKALGNLDQGQSGDKNHKLYLKTVQRWVSTANREYRSKIIWHVQVLGSSPTRKGIAFELQAVDPKSKTKLGDPFFALLSKVLAKRYDQLIQRSGTQETIELRGTIHMNVTFVRSSSTAGPFDKTKLAGPYAQFDFDVEATSLQPPLKVGK